MKNKKVLIYAGIVVIILTIIIIIVAIKSNKPMPINNVVVNNTTVAKTLVENLKQKDSNKNYFKLNDGKFLNEDTSFSKYSFINDNSIYIFNPNKLDEGEFVYKKVYDVDKNIKVMNIAPNSGSDIQFYDYNDTLYTLHDNNTDNKVIDSYDIYLNANYSLSDYLKWEYSTQFLGKKTNYDFMSNYVYVKDNVLYSKNYGNEKYPNIEKVSGNYEGEKILRIYNDRILKTDKGFYEIARYSGDDGPITTTFKIDLLSKYYDEVLTFTYEYVVLKDYTLIPIDDVMINRNKKYQTSFYVDRFEEKKNVFVE